MTLVLRGVALNEEPLTRPLVGRFDERGGTIGRSDTATFTLPDPERMISRVQAQVLHRDDGYWIENVSAASPILHNARPLSAGMRVMLRDGDELRVGSYTLQAAFEDDETSATILRGRTVIKNPLSAPAPPAAPAKTEPAPPPAAAPRMTKPTDRRPDATARIALGGEALWRGFIQGAGVESHFPDAPSPELLSAIGAMMRIAVEGIHRLVAMRTTAKNELQAEMTVIQVRGNNPLKFAPDAAVALRLLLQPPARGFLAGPAALREALIDLQSHEVGVMAGMRAALEAVLERFDPGKLEALLSTRSVLDSLLPAHRRARLWELYLQHYRSLREEAQQDFQRFFGEAFREAYEAQVRSLDAAHVAASPAEPGPGEGVR
jgi:predicted component of type VI protein secretion system